MIDGLFNQTSYVAAKRLLDVTALRQEAIASNIANVDVPHYKRLDVAPAFASELRQAIESKDPARLATSQPQLVTDGSAVAQRKDGNTVDLESELMRMNQNFLEHQLETQLISGSLLKLRLAITGRS
jgi:flagellar basal-body rod protein FlgB